MEGELMVKYFNDLLTRLEEIFYHELSECARPKSELVGIDFLRSKKIEGNTVEELLDNCIEELKKTKLVEDITYTVHGHGILVKLKVKNCIHLSKEIELKKDGIKPYCCPIANMILDRVLDVLDYLTTYTAGIEVNENNCECTLKCAIYKTMGKIGQVSDWTKC